MYKRPVPRPIFSVDSNVPKLARAEDSIVYKLIHTRPFPPYVPPPYAPISAVEDVILHQKRYEGMTDEDADIFRRKNFIVPTVVPIKKTKKTKKRASQDTDLDKVFSQFTKPVVKKKVLKAVVKKI